VLQLLHATRLSLLVVLQLLVVLPLLPLVVLLPPQEVVFKQ
jgi:hypothetical protein